MRIDERRIPISGALRPWISDISVTTIPIHDGEGTVVEPPDHSAALALRIFPGEYTDLVVMGPRTRALYHVGKPGPFCVSARIQPGHASSLLGHTVAGLRERIVPLSELWGEPGTQLAREIAAAGSDPTGIDERFLLGRIEQALTSMLSALPPRHRARADLAHRASQLLTDHGTTDGRPEQVSVTAARLHVSERSLRDLFTDAVGLGPKQFARIDRLRKVLAIAGKAPWARVATELGYHDQSHLNTDFRTMMGVPPGAYLSGRLPAAIRCVPHRPDRG
ncbi:transcriptional regulator, AraC family [Parafrankia sp. EAN1pec]|uniref:AraC family transcriptional regulator n=1 Tax=Parafrankia sp. (strain EAN1pec) TaxID=298653 RepID=UPI0000544EDF|nr:transcriptional regulator, AraC family [Frankia sp. EAN1pec]